MTTTAATTEMTMTGDSPCPRLFVARPFMRVRPRSVSGHLARSLLLPFTVVRYDYDCGFAVIVFLKFEKLRERSDDGRGAGRARRGRAIIAAATDAPVRAPSQNDTFRASLPYRGTRTAKIR